MESIDRIHIEKCTELLTLCLDADASFKDIAGLQIEAADLGR